MPRNKCLSDENIRALLADDDDDGILEEVDDISDEEFVLHERELQDDEEISSSDEDSQAESLEISEGSGSNCFTSPSGDKWFINAPPNTGRMPAHNVLTSRPGITAYAASRITEDPASAFELIFDNDMMETILTETNRQGGKVIKEWKTISVDELKAYIGLCILRGVFKSKHQAVRQLWDPLYGPPIFNQTMALRRFEEIRRVLRFDNPMTRQARSIRDKLAAVRLLIDGFISNSQRCYQHSECVTVDEQLYSFKGRCRYIQYMPSKPAKYGLKYWVLSDAKTYYVSNIEMYCGKDPTRSEDLGMHVVLKLSDHIKNTGRNITCDNFFTSLKLARELKKQKNSLVGTIRTNRREVPKEFRVTKGKPLYDTQCAYSEDGAVLISYKAKKNKNVVLLSTQHNENRINEGNEKKKSEIVLYYNSTKGGVDCVDERVSCYSVKYISKRWHVNVFCNILDLSCFNTFVLYTSVFPTFEEKKSHKRRIFLSNLGMSLSQKYRDARKIITPAKEIPSTPVQNREEGQKKRGRCSLCDRKKDKKTANRCSNCKSFVCSEHLVNLCSQCYDSN